MNDNKFDRSLAQQNLPVERTHDNFVNDECRYRVTDCENPRVVHHQETALQTDTPVAVETRDPRPLHMTLFGPPGRSDYALVRIAVA